MVAKVQSTGMAQGLPPPAAQHRRTVVKPAGDSMSCCCSAWNCVVKSVYNTICCICHALWRVISYPFCAQPKKTSVKRGVTTQIVAKPHVQEPLKRLQSRIMAPPACAATPKKKQGMPIQRFLEKCRKTLRHEDTPPLRQVKTFIRLLELSSSDPREQLRIRSARVQAFQSTPLLNEQLPIKMNQTEEEINELLRAGSATVVLDAAEALFEELSEEKAPDIKTYIDLIEDEEIASARHPMLKPLFIQFALEMLPEDAPCSEDSEIQRIINGLPRKFHGKFTSILGTDVQLDELYTYFDSHTELMPNRVLLNAIIQLIANHPPRSGE